MARSGFCNVCFGRVWVTHDGDCANGHAPYAISDERECDPDDPDAPPGPPPAFFDPTDEAPAISYEPLTLTPADALELARIPGSELLGEGADEAGDVSRGAVGQSEMAEVPLLTLPEIEWVPEPAADDAVLEEEAPDPSGPDAFFGSETDDGSLPSARPAPWEETLLEPEVPAGAVDRARQLGRLIPLGVIAACLLCYLLDTCSRM